MDHFPHQRKPVAGGPVASTKETRDLHASREQQTGHGGGGKDNELSSRGQIECENKTVSYPCSIRLLKGVN